MKRYFAAGGVLAAALLIGYATAGDSLKSGPQVGKPIPGPFDVLNCNGPSAGKSNCQI